MLLFKESSNDGKKNRLASMANNKVAGKPRRLRPTVSSKTLTNYKNRNQRKDNGGVKHTYYSGFPQGGIDSIFFYSPNGLRMSPLSNISPESVWVSSHVNFQQAILNTK